MTTLFSILSYMGSVGNIASSQSEPEVKYDRQSAKQVRRYSAVRGASKKKILKGLKKKNHPKNGVVNRTGVFLDEDGVKIFPDGTNIYKDGTSVWADGTTVYPDGTTVHLDGTNVHPDGSITTSDGTPVEIEQKILSPTEGSSSQ
jgi:hypothetical protein